MGARDQDRGHQGGVTDLAQARIGLDEPVRPVVTPDLTRGHLLRKTRRMDCRIKPAMPMPLDRRSREGSRKCSNRSNCMYNLHLSPEQLEIRDTVRDSVTHEVKPVALKPERLEARTRPLLTDVLDKASQMGLRTLALSEDAGGAGADTLTCCIVTEELAARRPRRRGRAGARPRRSPTLCSTALMTPEQRERFLPAFLADDRYHLALAEREPDRDAALGINYHRPQTARRRRADHRRARGRRLGHQRRQGPRRQRAARQAVRGRGRAPTRTARARCWCRAIRRASSVRESDHGRRWHHGACGRVAFDGLPGAGGESSRRERRSPLARRRRPRACRRLAALNLGIGRAAYEAALDYAQLRVQGGRRIIEHQAIGSQARRDRRSGSRSRAAAIWQAAWACGSSGSASPTAACPICRSRRIAKVFTSEAIYHATKDAAECFGAMGVMRDMPLQKYVHDALVCLHSGDEQQRREAAHRRGARRLSPAGQRRRARGRMNQRGRIPWTSR